jgi:opacity protein-like surface antigen
MKTLIKNSILILGLALTPAVSQAQTPQADSAAFGVDLGLFLPKQENLNKGIDFGGFYEYYPTARTSIRLGANWMNPKFDGSDDSHLRYIRIGGDLVYNWEGGTVHPFVGAGLGVYFLQERFDGEAARESETKVGGTLFGGVEYFTSNTVSVKGEAKYHLIQNLGTFNPDGLSLTIGLKKYF